MLLQQLQTVDLKNGLQNYSEENMNGCQCPHPNRQHHLSKLIIPPCYLNCLNVIKFKFAYKLYSLSRADLLGIVTNQEKNIMVKSYAPDPITVVVVRDGLYCWVKSVSR